jgi:hypothetical protein
VGLPDLESTPHLQSEYFKVKASTAKVCHISSLLDNIQYLLLLNYHSDWFQTLPRSQEFAGTRQSDFGGCVKPKPFIKEIINAYIAKDSLCQLWNHWLGEEQQRQRQC